MPTVLAKFPTRSFGDYIYFFDPIFFIFISAALFAANDQNVLVERNNFTLFNKSNFFYLSDISLMYLFSKLSGAFQDTYSSGDLCPLIFATYLLKAFLDFQ